MLLLHVLNFQIILSFFSEILCIHRSGDKAAQVPGLLLANEESERRYEIGAERARTRRARAAQSLSVSPPKPDEVHLIHNLYLQSIKQQRRRHNNLDLNSHDQQLFAMLLNGEETYSGRSSDSSSSSSSSGWGGGTSQQQTSLPAAVTSQISQELLSYYKDLQAENNSKWMKDTIYKSAQLMHIQVNSYCAYLSKFLPSGHVAERFLYRCAEILHNA